MATRAKPDTIKDACIDTALEIIEADGVEQLSLREVARRLGVSHQAPYKHFPTRDHILAAVVARCYAEFAAFLEARPRREDGWADLGEMGLAYLGYAREFPLKYRLMFNAPLPTPSNHPDMMAKARHAFDILQNRLTSLNVRDVAVAADHPARHDALFTWSCLHGLASLMQSDVLHTLPLEPADREVLISRLMARLGVALDPGC